MPRGGLSADPEKAQRQRDTLAAGRAIAAERRAQGLPTKRTEDQRANGTGRVAQGKPRGAAAPPPASAKPRSSSKPKPTGRTTNASRTAKPANEGEGRREPGRILRGYARILGYA